MKIYIYSKVFDKAGNNCDWKYIILSYPIGQSWINSVTDINDVEIIWKKKRFITFTNFDFKIKPLFYIKCYENNWNDKKNMIFKI
jgi:hypothetical protein